MLTSSACSVWFISRTIGNNHRVYTYWLKRSLVSWLLDHQKISLAFFAHFVGISCFTVIGTKRLSFIRFCVLKKGSTRSTLVTTGFIVFCHLEPEITCITKSVFLAKTVLYFRIALKLISWYNVISYTNV